MATGLSYDKLAHEFALGQATVFKISREVEPVRD